MKFTLRVLFELPAVAGPTSSITQNRDGSHGASGAVARIERDDDEQLHPDSMNFQKLK